MQKRKLFTIVFILLAGLAFVGFQCSSTEMTSAKLYIQQKNWDKALDALQKEVDKNPKNAEAFYYLGVVYGEKGQYDKVIDSFDKSLAASNEYKSQIDDSKKYYWAQLFNSGVSYFQRGSNLAQTNPDSSKLAFDKSANMFEYATRLEPDSADTYKNLSFVYMATGDNEKAIQPLQKLIDIQHAEDGYKYLGQIYYNMGVTEKDKYTSSKNPQDSIKAQEYFNKAIQVLEEGRKSFPGNSDILLTLSNSYINAGKVDVALSAFKAGVESDPQNKYYRYNYGVLLLGKNDYEGAAEQFKKAIEIDPEYQNAIYNIAVTYVKWGTAINKEAEDKGQMDNAEYKEKYQAALPYLEKSVQLEQNNAAIWELLGKVYTVLGMQTDAQNAFDKADALRK
ncbi:MAG TPA: tetratricopeptide repeat protein [Ignavibacteriaceae bacterium]|nr:tetratricopeptide repeat protein [Ignavibacteriaceae bacterium]